MCHQQETNTLKNRVWAHACSPRTWVEAVGGSEVWGYTVLYEILFQKNKQQKAEIAKELASEKIHEICKS